LFLNIPFDLKNKKCNQMNKITLSVLFLIFSFGYLSAQKNQVLQDTVRIDSLAMSEVGNDHTSEERDDDGANSYIPGPLHSSQDVYVNNTSFAFSIAYFRNRGYESRYQSVAFNGFEINSSITEHASYSQWEGLNHVIHYPENVINMNPATFVFGDIGGAVNYTTRASSYRKQVKIDYSLSNKTYTNRLMLTAATGILQKGWAFAASLSTRFGNQFSYVDGTVYDGYSYFVSAEKIINCNHAINLTAFGAPVRRSIQANAVQEIYDLLDNNYYNANWGWYNGKQRSARIRTLHEPVILFTHYYTSNENKYQITSTLASTFGKNNSTALNWYDAPDPRPDYYQYLPSYYKSDSVMFEFMTNQWLNNVAVRQIDWDHLYEVNQLAKKQGLRSQYIVENRVISHIQFGGASNLTYNLDDHTKLSAGVDVRGMKQRNYKTIDDLLGGLYWLDMDRFSESSFPTDVNTIYNDLDNKDAQLKEGDVFGYDYDLTIFSETAWILAQFKYNLFEFHLGGNVSGTEFWRTGNMRNGRFPNDSKGKSDIAKFLTYSLKAGLTYKITERNYFVLNSQYGSKAPGILHSFLSPRTRNTLMDSLFNERCLSADLSYVMNYPFMKMRVTGYYSKMMDRTKVMTFYHDDYSSLVNYCMTGIDQRHIGVELGAEIKLGGMFTLILAGNFGDYIYTSRPQITINADNGDDILGNNNATLLRKVYWKNYHVSGSPQAAGTIGIKFNHHDWQVSVNANYFDKIYCDMIPERRTSLARGTLPEDSELLQSIIAQERLKGQFTLDAFLSKSWRVQNKFNIGFNISVTNILNNKKLVTTAWEQYRFDFKQNDVEQFGNKYSYAFGTTFYTGFNIRF
jgi:hypothetical protein